MKRWFAVCSVLTCLAGPALAADLCPFKAPSLGAETTFDLSALVDLHAPQAKTLGFCPGRICSDDIDCACPGATSATCNTSIHSCVYTYSGSGPGGGTSGSGAICSPARFCSGTTDPDDCGPCFQGGHGVCGVDGVCRIP